MRLKRIDEYWKLKRMKLNGKLNGVYIYLGGGPKDMGFLQALLRKCLGK